MCKIYQPWSSALSNTARSPLIQAFIGQWMSHIRLISSSLCSLCSLLLPAHVHTLTILCYFEWKYRSFLKHQTTKAGLNLVWMPVIWILLRLFTSSAGFVRENFYLIYKCVSLYCSTLFLELPRNIKIVHKSKTEIFGQALINRSIFWKTETCWWLPLLSFWLE